MLRYSEKIYARAHVLTKRIGKCASAKMKRVMKENFGMKIYAAAFAKNLNAHKDISGVHNYVGKDGMYS